MTTDLDGATIDAARNALQRVLESPDFDASKRNCDFLRFVVEETLGGRSDRIKAYSIATLVFGRDENFDPQADPVVRFEARRLRRSLERYYLLSGKDDPIQITIPKGSYIPAFSASEDDQAAPAEAPSLSENAPREIMEYGHGPTIIVLPFETEGEDTYTASLGRGFVRHLIVALTRFKDLFVYGWETSLQLNWASDLRTMRLEHNADFVLTGGVSVAGERFTVEVVLIDARTGFSAWSAAIDRTLAPAEIIKVRDEFAERVAQTLGQPYGIIQARKAMDIEGAPPEALSSYDCVMRYYQYARTYDPQEFEPLRACLEKTISEDPSYAEAFACLSQLYTDAYRFKFAHSLTQINPRRRALELAHRAVQLAPDSSNCHLALSRAYWFDDDVEASLASLETGRELNPNDSLLMAELGLRNAVQTNWEKAESLLRGAYARNPALPAGFRVGLSLCHYAHRQFEAALLEARKVDMPSFPYGHVLEAIALVALKRESEAASIVNRLLANDKEFHKNLYADLKMRHVDPGIIDFIVSGLRKSGMRDILVSVG